MAQFLPLTGLSNILVMTPISTQHIERYADLYFQRTLADSVPNENRNRLERKVNQKWAACFLSTNAKNLLLRMDYKHDNS
jgi:hypothetical protein